VLPFYEEHELPVLRILTDRGTEFCGRPDKHDYQLFLAVNDADLDIWLHHDNTERTHQGKMCCGRTPFETMIEGKQIWKEKFVNQI